MALVLLVSLNLLSILKRSKNVLKRLWVSRTIRDDNAQHWLSRSRYNVIFENINNFKKSKIYILDDYFQDLSKIEKGLSIVTNLINKAAKQLTKINNLIDINESCAAIHIRRGDFLSKKNATVFVTQPRSEEHTSELQSH